MRFSQAFGIIRAQSEIDFVDIPLDTDIKLFMDPFILSVERATWFPAARARATSFFSHLIETIRSGRRNEAVDLVAALSEPNATRLGYSQGRSAGSSVGQGYAEMLVDALEQSEAVRSGSVVDLEDTALLVKGIDRDRVTDMLTVLIVPELALYTASQCNLHGITDLRECEFLVWDVDAKRWARAIFSLPADSAGPILLVPKVLIVDDFAFTPGKFITFYILRRLLNADLTPSARLSRMLANVPLHDDGTVRRQVLRDMLLKERGEKQLAADLAAGDPEALLEYKAEARAFAREMIDASRTTAIDAVHPHPPIDSEREFLIRTRAMLQPVDSRQRAVGGVSAICAALGDLVTEPRLVLRESVGLVTTVECSSALSMLIGGDTSIERLLIELVTDDGSVVADQPPNTVHLRVGEKWGRSSTVHDSRRVWTMSVSDLTALAQAGHERGARASVEMLTEWGFLEP